MRESEGGMRRIQNVVFLDQLRCDGSAHGGCQKGCMIFWRDEWLREATGECIPSGNAGAGFLYSTVTPEGQYVCQSTELIRATTQLHALDLRMYVRDIRAKSHSVWGLIRILAYAWYLRLRRYAIGRSYRVVEGGQGATPVAVLDLRPGELVLVKTPEKISATLDRNGKNRGLAFTVEMISFCGKVFRVLRRVERTIHDRTGRMIGAREHRYPGWRDLRRLSHPARRLFAGNFPFLARGLA